MQIPKTTDSPLIRWMTVEELREKALADKAAWRNHLAKAPISEKLRMLEEMRDLAKALKPLRVENKARVRAAIQSRSK